jgi:eukaryotic-like serine/threonine-protein kinase
MFGIEGLLAGHTLVDRYRIDAVVGRGGMGAVYRAHDLRLGREVAVKVITVAAGDAEGHRRLRARFLREARAAAGLHHPNVVQVFDYGDDRTLGLDFLVMELLRGEDLATRLNRKGPPAIPTALDILYQAARGLAAGHRAGLVHRDIKPGNLYLEPGDRIGEVQVKVLDFGIADITALDEETVTHLTVAGRSPFSPAYASPEQLRAEIRLTPATDVFSLGAVGFHLLTGKRAFRATDPAQMVVELSSSVAMELPRVRGLHPSARAIVQRALSPDPADRFRDASSMAAALEPLAAHHRQEREEEEDDTDPGLPEPEPRRARTAEPARVARDPFPSGTRAYTPPQMRAASQLRELASFPAPAPRVAPAPPAAMAPAQERGWLRRTARAVWELGVTTIATVLFAGSWFFVTSGLQQDDQKSIYLGAAASVVATPWAIHRLLRRPGSFRFSLLCCVAGSGVVALLLREQPIERVLAAVFVAQVCLCVGAERLTRPRRLDLLDE